jgi:hypothetical protein
VPTDLYYVVATVFGCKSLMDDTQAYLLNLLARVLPSVRSRNQSALPPREAAVVRWFAVAWILGRGLAFAALFWITIPVLIGYGLQLASAIGGD